MSEAVLKAARILCGPEGLPGSPGDLEAALWPTVGPALGAQDIRGHQAATSCLKSCFFSIWLGREEKGITRTGAIEYNFKDHHLIILFRDRITA